MTTYPDAVSVAKTRIAKGTVIGPNDCLIAVRTAFGLAADGKEPTAYAAWLAEGGHDGPNTHYSVAPPADVPGFFSVKGSTAGHVVVCAGGGMCYTTDFNGTKWVEDGKTYYVSISSLEAHGGCTWLGWSEVLEGVRIHAHVTA